MIDKIYVPNQEEHSRGNNHMHSQKGFTVAFQKYIMPQVAVRVRAIQIDVHGKELIQIYDAHISHVNLKPHRDE